MIAENFDPAYNGLKINFPGAGLWGEFLQTFYRSMEDSWISDKRKASQQFYHPDYVDLTSFCERISRTRTQEDYYSESLIGHDYFGEGTSRSFQEDDDYFTCELPFDFPFFGTIIQEDTDIYISSNGYIDFDSQSSHTDHTNTSSELASNKRIAPCWADLKTDGNTQQGEDVYIISNAGFLAIRWVAETYGDQEPVNFEVVLFPNGFIQFNYGAGNEDISPWDTAPTIGISKGDSSNYYLAEYNGETWLTNVNSDLFKHRSSITVHSPDGGEEWEVGTAQGITWENSGQVGNVKIDYSTNGGESWTNIVQSMDNNGRYTWSVPNNSSNTCKIKVSETDGNPYDISDAVFKIISTPTITVTSPNGSESWAAGSFHNITWTHTGIIGSVMIEYSTNGGNSYTTIVATTPNTGSYGWIVSNAPSQSCLVRVKALDTDGYPVDVSNSTFTITNN